MVDPRPDLVQVLALTASPFLVVDDDLTVRLAHPDIPRLLARAADDLEGLPLEHFVSAPERAGLSRWARSVVGAVSTPDLPGAGTSGASRRPATFISADGSPVEVGLEARPLEQPDRAPWICVLVTLPPAGTEDVVAFRALPDTAPAHAPPADVVHDLNNHLAVLSSYAGFVAEGLDDLESTSGDAARELRDRLRQDLTEVLRAVDGAAAVLHRWRQSTEPATPPAPATTEPATTEPATTRSATPAAPAPVPSTAERAHVLVVDDEDAVRELTIRILTRAGYRVTAVASPEAALALLDEPGVPVDLLLTDVVLGPISGSELRDRFAERRPGIAAVFMTGYTLADVVDRGLVGPGANLIEKPFTVTGLLGKIEEVLTGGA
jgi:CheY-like chemotaxis protein